MRVCSPTLRLWQTLAGSSSHGRQRSRRMGDALVGGVDGRSRHPTRSWTRMGKCARHRRLACLDAVPTIETHTTRATIPRPTIDASIVQISGVVPATNGVSRVALIRIALMNSHKLLPRDQRLGFSCDDRSEYVINHNLSLSGVQCCAERVHRARSTRTSTATRPTDTVTGSRLHRSC